MKVLVVGSGGREHALAWKLSEAGGLTELHAAPGNPGIARVGTCHPVRAEDGEGLLALAHALGVDLVVVGPEVPLVAGVADELRHAGIATFGPSAAAAHIEGSKQFAKEVMRTSGVATAETFAVARPPCVIKADGLAAGKGVFVCRTRDELDEGLRAVTAFGDARDERSFRTDDDEVDVERAREREQALAVRGTNRVAAAERGDPRIARRRMELLERRCAAQLPRERVLAAARPDEEHLHPRDLSM